MHMNAAQHVQMTRRITENLVGMTKLSVSVYINPTCSLDFYSKYYDRKITDDV